METVYSGLKPGIALKIMREEHAHLEEFMAVMEGKLRLDQNHLEDMKAFESTWNPKWSDSGIWPLISPVLKHLSEEIVHLEETTRDLACRLAGVPNCDVPAAHSEESFEPLEMPECLKKTYEESERRHKAMITPETQAMLEVWWEHDCPEKSFSWPGGLPEADLDYRRAVVQQHRLCGVARNWYSETLPTVHEKHQQRAEDIKKFLLGALITESKLYSDLSVSCTVAINSMGQFASTEYIGPRHREAEQETSHVLLQNYQYCNYLNKGRPSLPLFGLGTVETAALIVRSLRTRDKFEYRMCGNLRTAFMVEAQCTMEPNLKCTTWGGSFESILWAACMLDPLPLLRVSETLLKRYPDDVPSKDLKSVAEAIAPVARHDIFRIIVYARGDGYPCSLRQDYDRLANYLARCNAASGIVEAIWRKWDLENDCPFPDGVERICDLKWRRRWKVIWTETKEIYGPYIPLTRDIS